MAFSRQSLGESTLFVTSIWTKIMRDSQHHQEKVQDWASHLQHLKSILIEFNPRCTPIKDVLCWYFYKNLRPSIRLWIDKKSRDLDGWNALIKKAIRAEVKAKIQASASQDLDQPCHWSNQPVHTLAAKAQAQLVKDSWVEKPKAWALKLTLCSSNLESFAKARREKKKDRRQRDQRNWQGQKGSTPATRVNAAKPGEAKKKKNNNQNWNCLGRAARNLNQIKYYNCQKMCHYINKCSKPSKN